MPLAQGQVLNNRYRIVNLLGQGGFGAVYRAWDVNLKRPCAVKENLDTSPEAQAQFEREALILAGLIHPNLARVTDHFFVPDQGQYLVMDFVEGEDLHQMIESSGGPISEQDAVRWVSQVCDALSYMHTQQPPIIHRDIKPANIKVTPEGKAMLVDFGIAKIYDPKLRTTVGARAITPGYSPPEQYGQGKTDLRSDIFALGATMYTMLTARVPPDSVDVLTDSQPGSHNHRRRAVHQPGTGAACRGCIRQRTQHTRCSRKTEEKIQIVGHRWWDCHRRGGCAWPGLRR
jgi:serine/threonine-protein kinase